MKLKNPRTTELDSTQSSVVLGFVFYFSFILSPKPLTIGSKKYRKTDGLLRNYNFQDGTVTVFITDEKFTNMIIQSTMIAD